MNRVVKESTLGIADMNYKGYSDCESNLLEDVDRWCWGRVGVSVEMLHLCEFPIVVGEFEDAFWAWEVCDFVVHHSSSSIGFCWCERDRGCGLCIKEKGLKDIGLERPKGQRDLLLWGLGSYCDQVGHQ